MKTTSLIFKNEQGSTIVVAMLILVILTIIGISATNTSKFEAQIVGNEHRYQIDFYVADSGWKEAAMWLNTLEGPPAEVNPGSDRVVKNFGSGTAPADPAPTVEDVVGAPDSTTVSQYGVPNWYQVEYVDDIWVGGEGKGRRMFTYRVTSNANQTQEVEVMVTKKFKVGPG
jgi:Tfp pilus assembly protein PilX